jgi:hypothetical protein
MSYWVNMLSSWQTSGSSHLRYNDMCARIGDVHGKIDFLKARDLIDYMNPLRYLDPDSEAYKEAIEKGYKVWDTYYEVDGEIKGHHDIFDNQERIVEVLYGYYKKDNPWVRIDLKPFANMVSAAR